MDIAIRAYVSREELATQGGQTRKKKQTKRKSDLPSEWVLIFDSETTTDASQKLCFGTYQVRKHEELLEAGIFYDSGTLSKAEQET